MVKKGFKRQKVKNQQTFIPISVGHQDIQVAVKSTSRDMMVAFYARPYDSPIEIKNIPRRQELHRQNQGFKFPKSSFSNRDNKIDIIQFRGERKPQHVQK